MIHPDLQALVLSKRLPEFAIRKHKFHGLHGNELSIMLWHAQGQRCFYCNNVLETHVRSYYDCNGKQLYGRRIIETLPSLDHFRPLIKSPIDSTDFHYNPRYAYGKNSVLCHSICNWRKGDSDPTPEQEERFRVVQESLAIQTEEFFEWISQLAQAGANPQSE